MAVIEAKRRNVFGHADIVEQLAEVRREIERAVLIAAGRRSAGGNVPDLLALRRREAELIVRADLAKFPPAPGYDSNGAPNATRDCAEWVE